MDLGRLLDSLRRAVAREPDDTVLRAHLAGLLVRAGLGAEAVGHLGLLLAGGRFVEVEGTERELPADLVFLAMGFTGPERGPLVEQLGVALDERGNVRRDGAYTTSVPGVFVAGDAGRGQSLIVWAIAEGRAVAAAVDAQLMGSTNLPAPIRPTDRPLVV